MDLRSRNFLPFHIKKEERPPPPIPIEPRPGLEPEDDTFDLPFRFEEPVEKVPEVRREPIGEYHHSNMTFWWFIMGAILISFFVFVAEYSENGVRSQWYRSLEFFPGSPDPVAIFLGNAFLFFMTAWATYHMFKYRNTRIVRYGGVFLMASVYILVLVWAIVLFDDNKPRDALLLLMVAGLFMVGWIILARFNRPDDHEILLPLGLGLAWVIYLLYFNIGIINENENPKMSKSII